MYTVTVTMHCNEKTCKNEVSLTGSDTSKSDVYQKATKAGWRFVDKDTQWCPDHRPARVTKASTKASKATGKGKKATGTKGRKAAIGTSAPPKGSQPVKLKKVAFPSTEAAPA